MNKALIWHPIGIICLAVGSMVAVWHRTILNQRINTQLEIIGMQRESMSLLSCRLDLVVARLDKASPDSVPCTKELKIGGKYAQ